MKTIYTAIFGNYDDLKEPRVITPGWQYICFTDRDLKSDVWEIKKIPVRPHGVQRTARHCKIMFHEYVDTEFSIWIDASFIINCNLDDWWQRFSSPITCLPHPYRDCVYDEAEACIRNKRDKPEIIQRQMNRYRNAGLPKHYGLIASGILMRQRTAETITFCQLWWQQLEQHSVRDQLSFAYAAWKMPIYRTTKWDYRTPKEFIHVPHLHKRHKKQFQK